MTSSPSCGGDSDLTRSLIQAPASCAKSHRGAFIASTGALEQGELEQARRYLAEGLALTRDLDDRFGLARALEALARLALAQSAPREALGFAGAAAKLRLTSGSLIPPTTRPWRRPAD